jgi:hypothetical protein
MFQLLLELAPDDLYLNLERISRAIEQATLAAVYAKSKPVAWMIPVMTMGGDLSYKLSFTESASHIGGQVKTDKLPLYSGPQALLPDSDNADVRYLSKWLNEGQTAPIDKQALARVLAAINSQEMK